MKTWLFTNHLDCPYEYDYLRSGRERSTAIPVFVACVTAEIRMRDKCA